LMGVTAKENIVYIYFNSMSYLSYSFVNITI
jgi:hypothetical protein